MLNGYPLNGALINGALRERQRVVLGPGQIPPPLEPGAPQIDYEVSASSFVWQLHVIVDDADVSGQLVGSVEIDREEGAAGIATFRLHIASPVTPDDWRGLPVRIDYQSEQSSRRFTGRVSTPSWDPLSRLLTCECSDMRQHRVEALSIPEIDALVGGLWSADVFDPLDGRSHWDYAEERLSTRPASLDCATDGSLRVTSWYAKRGAQITFGAGSTVDQSVSVVLADLYSLTNVVEIEYSYRFSRRWQENQNHTWWHPDTAGLSGINGWCAMVPNMSTELPDRDMVESALSGLGQTLLSTSTFTPMPPSGVYCDPPSPLRNEFYPQILIGFGVVGGRRWVQPVTERYRLRLEATQSVERAGEQVARESLGFEVESERAADWESTPFGVNAPRPVIDGGVGEGDVSSGYGSVGLGGGSTIAGYDDGSPGHFDDGDPARRVAAGNCLLQIGQTQILASHRGTSVGFDVPTSLCADVDLTHTVRLDDQGVLAQGKVRQLVDRFDFDAGTAITTIVLAIMRGGEINGDLPPLELPEVDNAPADSGGGGVGVGVLLPTQIGGRLDSPTYDPDKLGFSGNYESAWRDGAAELFPREIKLASREISADRRDELVIEVPPPGSSSTDTGGDGVATYSDIPPTESTPGEESEESALVFPVSIPNDLLEL